MIDFNFYIPTQIRFKQGCINELPDNKLIPGKNCMLIAYDGFNNKELIRKLEKKCNSLVVVDEFQENPRIEFVKKISNEALKAKVNIIIAIGGGSSIDTAKAVAWMYANPDWFPEVGATDMPANIKIIAIPTTAGTGSEVTPYSILTDHAGNKKILNHHSLFPTIAYCDPLLTVSMPQGVTANSGIDALSHAIEAYFSIKCHGFMESLAINNFKRVETFLPQAIENPRNINAREQMMLAAIEGGMALATCGTVIVHALGYCLTHKFGYAHGKSNAVLLANFVNILAKKGSNRARKVQQIFHDDLDGFIQKCGISTKLPVSEIDDVLINQWVKAGMGSYGRKNSILPLEEADVRAILCNSL
jgi:alcohol dehydrogenase